MDDILRNTAEYYTNKINAHGASAKGVDWNSEESQLLRFDKLLTVCDGEEPFSIIDYGCGYGALLDHLRTSHAQFTYTGFDISDAMITRAQEIHRSFVNASFVSSTDSMPQADFCVSSGIFNVRQSVADDDWKQYMLTTVESMATLSRKGFSFNVLSLYSDVDKRRGNLYYADPLFWFDHCKKRYSRFVSLLHDYPLYEFTIIVKM